MALNQEQKEWIITAIEKGYTIMQIKKLLVDNGYEMEKVLEMLEYSDFVMDRKGKEIDAKIEAKEREKRAVEEGKFEDVVKSYMGGNDKELTRKEKKEVRQFLKNVERYSKTMEISLGKIRDEVVEIKKKFSGDGKKKINNELEILRKDLIEKIDDSKEILQIPHPRTGEEVNKQNMQDLSLQELIELMEENIRALNMIVNGKIMEEEA